MDDDRDTRRRGRSRLALMVVAVVTSLLTVSACGGSGDGGVITVGGATIPAATVDHWARILAGGARREVQRERAAGYLISSYWLLGEVAEKGIGLAPRAIQETLARKLSRSFPNGSTEEQEYLKAIGQTRADLTFEAKAELAAARIREALEHAGPAVTDAEIEAYYAAHSEEFTTPERRVVYITNRKTKAEALALIREARARKDFAAHSEEQAMVLSPETYSKSRSFDANLQRAVHVAKLHALSAPVKQHVDYYVFEVKAITPSVKRPIAEVKDAIRRTLAKARERGRLAGFVASWRTRWTAKTTCRTGYVVPKCREYRGKGSAAQDEAVALS